MCRIWLSSLRQVRCPARRRPDQARCLLLSGPGWTAETRLQGQRSHLLSSGVGEIAWCASAAMDQFASRTSGPRVTSNGDWRRQSYADGRRRTTCGPRASGSYGSMSLVRSQVVGARAEKSGGDNAVEVIAGVLQDADLGRSTSCWRWREEAGCVLPSDGRDAS